MWRRSVFGVLALATLAACGPEGDGAAIPSPGDPRRPLTEADIAALAEVPPNCTRPSAGEESVEVVGPADGLLRLWTDGARESGRIHWLYIAPGVVPEGVTARFTLREAANDRRVLQSSVTLPPGATLQPAAEGGPRFRMLINYGPCGEPGARFDATTILERITEREYPAAERGDRWWILSDLDEFGGEYLAAAPRDAFPTPREAEMEAADTIPSFAPMPPTLRAPAG
jgi:hypothetical protein